MARLTHKEKEASKLAQHLDFERVRTELDECKHLNSLTCETTEPLFSPSQQDTVKTTEELSRILESTRDHLESQLSRAEAEKIQLAAQIQVCGLRTNSHFCSAHVGNNVFSPGTNPPLMHMRQKQSNTLMMQDIL